MKFSAVGAMGICVQLGAAYFCGSALKINALAATALAVEMAVLHNFCWHEKMTWADRRATTRTRLVLRLLTFNATTGLFSLSGNLAFVSLWIWFFHLPLVLANLLAVCACSLINFIVNDKIVFRASCEGARQVVKEARKQRGRGGRETQNSGVVGPYDPPKRRGTAPLC